MCLFKICIPLAVISDSYFLDEILCLQDMLHFMVESGGERVKSWVNIIEANGGIADIRVDDCEKLHLIYHFKCGVWG